MDGAAAATDYASIRSVILDQNDASEDGQLVIAAQVAGSITDILKIGPGVAVGTAADQGVNTLNAGTLYEAGTSLAAKYQPLDGELTALAGLASAADRVPYFTGDDTAALATFTAFGRSLVDDADAATARSTLGLDTCFYAHKNAVDQTGVLPSTDTKVTFTTESFDVGSFYDAANSKWVPPAGKVRVTAVVLFSATNMVDVSNFQLYIYKNGAITLSEVRATSGVGAQGISTTGILDVDGNDEIEVYAFLAGAGNKTISGSASRTYFCGEVI